MSCILVCPTPHAGAVTREWRPSHVVGFSAPGDDPPGDVGGDHRRLRLVFNDIAAPAPGLVAPSRGDVAALLAFGGDWDGSSPFLVHCRMGISRSTSAALILAAAARPLFDERILAERLRASHPCATPNPLMIALADGLLGRSGRLVAAVRAIGRGEDFRPYRMFSLDLAATA